MTDLNLAILTALSQHTSYLYRLSSAEVNKEVAIFDELLERNTDKIASILRNLTQVERDSMAAGQYSTPRLKNLRDLISDWQKDLQTSTYESFQESAIALAANESAYVAKIAGESAAVALEGAKIYKESMKFPVTGGQLVNELFNSLAVATAENVRNNIRQGISDGLTNDQILRAIIGSEDVPSEPSVARTMRIEIERTVRTARMHVANSSFLDTYQALGYTHVKYLSVTDGRTSKICASRDGNVYPIDGPMPSLPAHPNCRSVYTGTDEKGELIGRRPYVADSRPVSKIPKEERDSIIGQMNANTDYAKWFSQQDAAFQKEWLGESKYKLYKDGGYKIERFVDPLGKEYSLAALRELDSATFKRLGL